jgi:hypothetical protein
VGLAEVAWWQGEAPRFAIGVFSFALQGVYLQLHALKQLAAREVRAVIGV